jgi:hypothetical protein
MSDGHSSSPIKAAGSYVHQHLGPPTKGGRFESFLTDGPLDKDVTVNIDDFRDYDIVF